MWLFHPLGFCSVVADATNKANLLVRGRIKGDLERLFPDAGKVEVTPKSDYQFRLSVPRDVVADRFAEMLASINYGNFKNAAPKDRHDAYLDVWTTMYRMQQDRAPRRRPKKRQIRHAAALPYDYLFDLSR